MEIIAKKSPGEQRKGQKIIRQRRVKLGRKEWRNLNKKKFDENYDKIKWEGGVNKMKYLILIMLVFMLVGCATTAGPFVTGISSDGKGGLVIQKGYVEYNQFLGTIANKEAGESSIKLLPEDKNK